MVQSLGNPIYITHINPGLQPSSSHHLRMLRMLILSISGGTYSCKSIPNDRFLRNFFMAGLFTRRVFAKNLLKGNRRRNIFFFISSFDA